MGRILTRCFLVLALLVVATLAQAVEETWKDSEHILKRKIARDYKLRDLDEHVEAVRQSHRRTTRARRNSNFQMKSLHEQQKPVSEKDWRRLEERRAFEEFVMNLSDEEKRQLREERALRRKEQRAQRRSWLKTEEELGQKQ